MGIVGIESLVYGVVDVAAAVKFHLDWGLRPVRRSADRAEFALEDGTTVVVCNADDPALPVPHIRWKPELEGSTVREVVWGVDTPESLRAIAAELSTDRPVSTDAEGGLHCRDDLGNAIAFRVTRRTAVRHEEPERNGVGITRRLNRRGDGAKRRTVNPSRFSHMVYWVSGDPAAPMRFYTERLGFRVTDRVVDGSAFLRAPSADDHHSLFLQRRDGFEGFQHVAYEVATLDDVMLLGSHMEQAGWRTNVGPIRHNVGASLSWYVWNPAGGVSEALTDIDRVDDRWQPETFDPGSPDFFGHTWVARPEQKDTKPADWP